MNSIIKIIKRHIIICISVVIYLSIQLLTLPINPLPWYDEVYFASMSWGFIQDGTLVPEIARHALYFQAVKIYGFIHFLLGGLFLKIFGFDIFTYRLLVFLSGLGCVIVLHQILKKNIKNTPISHALLIASFLLEPFFNLSLHEGRMDLLALFFILCALFNRLKSTKQALLLTGLCSALALLTTSRSLFLILPIYLDLFFQTLKNRKINTLLYSSLPLITIYGLWIILSFGSISAMWDHYQQWFIFSQFLGGTGYVPTHEKLLLVLVGLVLLLAFIKVKQFYTKQIISIALLSIIIFYLFVHDYGPYSIFILPYFYIILSKYAAVWKNRLLSHILLLILLIFNFTYFSAKNIQTLASYHQRNPKYIEKFIKDHVPAGSKVIGEPMTYYAVKKAGSDYQLMDYYNTLERREYIHREIYQYDYLIITDHLKWRKPEVVRQYMENEPLEKVARFTQSRSPLSKTIDRWGFLSTTERTGYNCTIYKRKTHQEHIQ